MFNLFIWWFIGKDYYVYTYKDTKEEMCKFYFQHVFVWGHVETLDMVGGMTLDILMSRN